MNNWRQPRLIAIAVILAIMIAAGIAAVAWVALTAGGVAGTNAPRAQSVAQLDSASADPPGTASATVRGDCPASDQPPPVSHRPGAAQQLVPDGESWVLICRYRGIDPPEGGAAYQLLGANAETDLATVRALAAALNALRPVTGSDNCPADVHSEVVAYFRYPGGVDDPVVIDPLGCAPTSNGRITRLWSGAVAGRLLELTKPVSARVATLSGHARLCGGIAPGRCRTLNPSYCGGQRCVQDDRVVAETADGTYLGQAPLRHGRFRLNLAAPGRYTLKLLAVNHVLATIVTHARLGHRTTAVFTIPVK